MKSHVLPVISLFSLAVSVHSAEAPRLLPFQARLADAAGKPLADGATVIQFQLFALPTGGSPVWAGELHRVTVKGGLVNVLLGSKNPLPLNDPTDDSLPFFGRTLYLQATPDADGDGKIVTEQDLPLLPRQALVPVLFAAESALSRTSLVSQISLDSRRLAGRDWSTVFTAGSASTASPQLDGQKLAGGSVGRTQLAGEVVESLTPTGTVIAWMGVASEPPPGWEFCRGQEVSRTDPKYARLFGVIRDSSGAGDGSTTFRLPDLRAMFLRGTNRERTGEWADPEAGGRYAPAPGGACCGEVGSLQWDTFESHYHSTYTTGAAGGTYDNGSNFGSNPGRFGLMQTVPSSSAGGPETRPNNVAVEYLIRL